MTLLLKYLQKFLSVLTSVFKTLISFGWFKKIGKAFLALIILVVAFLAAINYNLFNLFGEMPTTEQIDNTAQSEASEIFSADGKLMGKYFSENRSPVLYEEISPRLVETLICTEDARFYEHHGIDWRGLLSAAKDMAHGKARGASTITQQLAKNMFKMRSGKLNKGRLCGNNSFGLFITKMKEWITAVKIEGRYNKQQILTMYLNTVDFGSNAFGIRTAAKTYFGVSPSELSYSQSAVLVGLLKATSYYNPKLNPKNALQRRNVVLANLRDFHYITKDEYSNLCKEPIKLDYSVEKNYDGWGLYFRSAVADYLRPWCKKNNINLYTAGLKIHTTLDSTMQRYAERAVFVQMKEVQRRFDNHWSDREPWQNEQHKEIVGFVENVAKHSECYPPLVKRFKGDSAKIFAVLNTPRKMQVFDNKAGGQDTFYCYENGERKQCIGAKPGLKDTVMSPMDSIRYTLRFLHCSFLAMEPNTGYVKAWVGDLDFPAWKYDKVKAYRQPGSTFKLFDYTEAFKQGLCPCEERQDKYVAWEVWDKGKRVKWTPHNADGVFTGREFSLKAAFARSINSIAVQIAQECGIENINKTAREMGIHSFLNDTVPATALGACDVSLYDLVNSYCTAVNDGYYHNPILVTKIEDRNGKVIYEAKTEQKKVLDYEVAFLIQDLLKGGLTEPEGTTGALWEYIHPILKGNEFGGKTGTSSNHSDAWFVGVTPKLVAGSWVGGEYRSIHFRTGELGQGSRTALPVFGYFMRYVLQDPVLAKTYSGEFPKAKERISRNYLCKRYYNPVAAADSSNWDAEGADGELHLDE